VVGGAMSADLFDRTLRTLNEPRGRMVGAIRLALHLVANDGDCVMSVLSIDNR
jgi:hypothetical protein